MSYLAIKSAHLIGVIAWFAGLFYIFRLFVYHVENRSNDAVTQVLKTMERRLYYAITWPAMLFTVFMGGWMLYLNPELLRQGWFHAKLTALLFLFGYHFFAGYARREFLEDRFFLSAKQCRFINEVPTLVLLVVVPLAVIKPF